MDIRLEQQRMETELKCAYSNLSQLAVTMPIINTGFRGLC